MSQVRAFVNNLFKKHLLITNAVIGSTFMGAGDLIQQTIEHKLVEQKSYDLKRTGNMTFGGFFFGMFGHAWYSFLDKKFPGTTRVIITKKILADGAMGPPFALTVFLSVGYMEGKSTKDSLKSFADNILLICVADWAFYLPMQVINFYYLHPRYRVLFVSGLALVYDVFLSYVLHKDIFKEGKSKQ